MNSNTQNRPRDVVETALVLLLLFILLFMLYQVLGVFAGVFTYAIIFSVSFAGSFESLVKVLKNKRGLAAFIYAAILIAVVALPFYFIISTLARYAGEVQQWLADVETKGVPPLPSWVEGVPVAGKKIVAFWQELQADPKAALTTYEPKIKQILGALVFGGAGMLGAVLEFIVGIIVSSLLLANAQTVVKPLYAIMQRIAGEANGQALVDATGRAVKGVAIGVLGTAFIAAFFAWVGFLIAGIPFAMGLTALTFFLVVTQLGPIWVFIPVAIWLFATGQTGWGIFMSIYTLAVMIPIDNVVKPMLIARAGKLPILVLFLGVIGGMVLWGFTGMFKGAIILAVFYTILSSWLARPTSTVASNAE